MSDQVVLHGGPLGGHSVNSFKANTVHITHPCVNESTQYDYSVYDKDGLYLYSIHPGNPIYETCECSLCPGHKIDTTESIKYYWVGPPLDRNNQRRSARIEE